MNKLSFSLPKLLSVFVLFLVFVGCQQDEEWNKPSAVSPEISVKRISFDEVPHKNEVLKILGEIGNQKNTDDIQGRGVGDVHNEEYGFTVDTDVAYYTEWGDGRYSYTFYISMDNPNDEYMENLLLDSDGNGGYKAFIVHYGYTEEEFEVMGGTELNSRDVVLQAIDFDYGGVLDEEGTASTEGRIIVVECWDIYQQILFVCEICHQNPCEMGLSGYRWVWIGEECTYTFVGDSGNNPPSYPDGNEDGGGGNGNNGDGDGSTNDGTDCHGYGPDGCPPEIVVVPVAGNEEEDPCNELNKLVENPDMDNPNPFVTGNHEYPRLAILNMDNFMNSNLEHGYGLYNAGNVPLYGPYAHYIANTGAKHIYFPAVATQFGTVHIHQLGEGYPMFSHDDIYSLLDIRDIYELDNLNPSGDDLFVAILVVKQGGDIHTYAIKIEDINKLNALKNKHQDKEEWKDVGDNMVDLYEDRANGMNGTPTQYQRAFLEFINEFDDGNGLGISLYEMEVENFGTPNIAMKWSKLSLSQNGYDVVKTPCD